MSEQKKKKKAKVLVADDDQSIRKLICTIVQRERIEIDSAADGQAAVEHLSEKEYSVILLDLMMPRLDGFGVIDYLKAHPQSRKPVVIVITAYADQKFREVDPEIVAGVIRKPFEVAEIGSIVRLCVTAFESVESRDVFATEAAEAGKGGTGLPVTIRIPVRGD